MVSLPCSMIAVFDWITCQVSTVSKVLPSCRVTVTVSSLNMSGILSLVENVCGQRCLSGNAGRVIFCFHANTSRYVLLNHTSSSAHDGTPCAHTVPHRLVRQAPYPTGRADVRACQRALVLRVSRRWVHMSTL